MVAGLVPTLRMEASTIAEMQELAVIGLGLGLDVFAAALACFGGVGKRQAASLGGDLGELLDDVEEGRFIAAGKLPKAV